MNTPYREPAKPILPPPMVHPREMLRRLAAVGVYKSMFLDLIKNNRSYYTDERERSVYDLNRFKDRLEVIETKDLSLRDALNWFKFATFEDLSEACNVEDVANTLASQAPRLEGGYFALGCLLGTGVGGSILLVINHFLIHW